MLHPHLQQFAYYSLPMDQAFEPSEVAPAQPGDQRLLSRKEFDTLDVTPKVGESILVPSRGLTIQVGAIHRGCVSLRISVPSRTKVFRMGAFRRRGRAPSEARKEGA